MVNNILSDAQSADGGDMIAPVRRAVIAAAVSWWRQTQVAPALLDCRACGIFPTLIKLHG
jgi:hypothetical protein